MTIRHLILLLGDQLDERASALVDADPAQDVVLMIEAQEESTHVRSHQVRTALFLSAMRHFAAHGGGRYLLDFPSSPVPADVGMTLENLRRFFAGEPLATPVP